MTKKINGWNEWSKYVLKELERNNETHESMLTKLDQIGKDVGLLKYKMSAIGITTGVVGAGIALLIKSFV